MEYLHLVYQLPAVIAGTTIVAYLSPWKFQARFTPLVMFLTGLLVLLMPEVIDLALALTLPAAWIQEKVLGISFTVHDPVSLPKLPKIRLRRPKVVLQEFATQAYPDPDAEDDVPPELEAAEQVSTVRSFVPPL